MPTIYVLSKNKKKIKIFHLKKNIFTAVKYCCILHGRVIVMLNLLLNVLSYPYHLDESTLILGASAVIVHIYFIFRLIYCEQKEQRE